MNAKQYTQYLSIREGYKTEPRWVAARELMADPAANAEEYAFAAAEAAKYERYAVKSAEAARIGGL